jgi:hypothetical protein
MPTEALPGVEEKLQEASTLYAEGDYSGAYKRYLKLAKSGEIFSRYRISYMAAVGLGTKQDPVESLAWAVLAEDIGPDSLTNYRKAIAALVPEKHRRKAQRKTDTYRKRWDTKTSAGGKCTGSRLAAACGGATSAGGRTISWPQDHSGDPEQLELIEGLNQAILKDTFHQQAIAPTG